MYHALPCSIFASPFGEPLLHPSITMRVISSKFFSILVISNFKFIVKADQPEEQIGTGSNRWLPVNRVDFTSSQTVLI